MRCTSIRLADASAAIVCGGRARRAARCHVAGCTRSHVALCDHPLGGGRTCDVRLCARHRVRLGADDDRCPDHAAPLLLVSERNT